MVRQVARHIGQRLSVDHAGPQFGQVAFRAFRVPVEEFVGDRQPEHRVAQELQPLVGRQPAVLIGVAAMGQRQRDKFLRQLDAHRVEQRLP